MKPIIVTIIMFITLPALAQRAREAGIPFEGTTGKFNAITDVKGVEVGFKTLISGEGKNVIGKGPVRTGVTAIFPTGKTRRPVFANWYTLNGNGEMTGTTWITSSGFLETPVLITNTNSVGVARDAMLKWFVKHNWYKNDHDYSKAFWYTYPVVAETYDGFLNDIYGFHVKEQDVFDAMDNASPGAIEEGNVGGGTGMMCLGFKGGTGTSSRIIKMADTTYTLGVLVQANFGNKKNLRIAGVPVGRELKDTLNMKFVSPPESAYNPGQGSIIVIVATDAPLLPHQLKRIAERVSIGIGIVGGQGENSSGDIFLAFSTANPGAFSRNSISGINMLPNELLDPFFNAAIQATEEAIINTLLASKTMTGINGNTIYGLPAELVLKVLKKYNRIK